MGVSGSGKSAVATALSGLLLAQDSTPAARKYFLLFLTYFGYTYQYIFLCRKNQRANTHTVIWLLVEIEETQAFVTFCSCT
ncbi:hypothetical protein MAY18_31050, partial [Escherichia coli]